MAAALSSGGNIKYFWMGILAADGLSRNRFGVLRSILRSHFEIKVLENFEGKDRSTSLSGKWLFGYKILGVRGKRIFAIDFRGGKP